MNIQTYYTIDKNSPIPLYFQIKEIMIELIKNETYQPGEKLPTEAEFCQSLDISRPTIRQAFQALEKAGYIERKKAKGTFVSSPKVEGYFFQKLNSFNDEMKLLGLTPSTKLLKQCIIQADEFLSSTLQIKENDEILYLERLRYADQDIMVYVETYVPISRCPYLANYDFSQNNISLYNVFHKHNQPVAYVDRVVEAKNAEEELANVLDIRLDAAVYTITTCAYSDANQLLEYSVANYRGDRNKFSLRLVQR